MLDNALRKVWQPTLFAWIQTSNCFVGVLESSLEVVSAKATSYMSNRVDTRSCQCRKFWPAKTSIFETSRNGLAKMVWVAKIAFAILDVELLLLSVLSTLSPYDCSKLKLKTRKYWFPEAWVNTVHEDLSAIYCASPQEYNRNLSDNTRIRTRK